MRDHYELSKMKGLKKNPYAKHLKAMVTIRLDKDVVAYFKSLTTQTGLTYQNLINLYLRDCVTHQRTPKLVWGK